MFPVDDPQIKNVSPGNALCLDAVLSTWSGTHLQSAAIMYVVVMSASRSELSVALEKDIQRLPPPRLGWTDGRTQEVELFLLPCEQLGFILVLFSIPKPRDTGEDFS